MDFITLATETDPRRIHRWLDEILGNDDAIDISNQQQQQQQMYQQPSAPASSYGYAYADEYAAEISTSSSSSQQQKPFLSKAAEAELYLLATNFLLYVAMVIVSIIVAKIYFPESLERSEAVPRARNFNYRMAEAQANNEDDYYGSDVEEDDDEHHPAVVDEEDVLDSDDDDNDHKPARSPPPMPKQSKMGNAARAVSFFDFQQESLSKTQVLKRLLFCSLMLNMTFVLWGALQERMLTRKYPRHSGEYFTYSYALVFTNRFWTLIMSGMLLLYFKPRLSGSTVVYEYSFPSISNMLSSWCQYEALRYVSFPATTLFKAFKLAPVMAMGKILGNKTYPLYDYWVAVLIGVGITMFMTSTDDLRLSSGFLGGDEVNTAWTGVMLLFLFLFFDSFTSQFQSRMFQRHRDLSMVELMFATSAYSTVLSFVTLLHTKELYPAFAFVMEHSEIHLHFLLFSICSTIGQLFIFYTIKNFGAVVFTLIMTTRILLSIALSCVLYGHKVTATGFFGLMLVIAAVLYRIRRKAQGQQLLKWQGIQDDAKEYELVHEWHEHVDM